MKAILNRKATLLMVLCWLVYTCSYIGKLSYSANIHLIETTYGVSHAQTGLVSTLFFFTYGLGQIVNGIFCKKYNLKYVVFVSLLIGALMNLLLILVPDFEWMKYFWLINGAAMSFLWSGMIRLLSETLNKKDTDKAVVAMGTTVATGTILVYGMSALFVAFLSYEWTFYMAAVILGVSAFVWLFSFNSLVDPLKAEREAEQTEEKHEGTPRTTSAQKKGFEGLVGVMCMLALFAVMNNFVKDGVRSWAPAILKKIYDTPDALSILLTLILPMIAIAGVGASMWLYRYIKDYIGTCTVFFLLSAICVGGVIACLRFSMIVTVAGMALISFLMSAVNNVITSMAPLYMREKMNSGMIAGVLNGCCYLGSTISSYGLGAIADANGWKTVFIVLLAVNCVAVVLGAVFWIVFCLKKKI